MHRPNGSMPQVSGVKFGGWAALPVLVGVEALAKAGMDFVTLDLQHGGFNSGDALASIQLLDSLGVEAFIRIAADELHSVNRFLDYGVAGVIVAVVSNPSEIESAIRSSRYQPDGTRSYGGQRYGLRAEPANVREIQPAIYAQIETIGGVENLDAIAATPGIAGLFVGPADLALALGLQPDEGPGDQRWQAVISRILELGVIHRLETGMTAADGEDAAYWARRGFTRVVIGSDVGLLRLAISAELARARGATSVENTRVRGNAAL